MKKAKWQANQGLIEAQLQLMVSDAVLEPVKSQRVQAYAEKMPGLNLTNISVTTLLDQEKKDCATKYQHNTNPDIIITSGKYSPEY